MLPDGVDVVAAGLLEPGTNSLQEDVTSCPWEIDVPGVDPRGPRRRRSTERSAPRTAPRPARAQGRNEVDDLRPSVLALSCAGPDVDGVRAPSRSSAPDHAASDRPSSPRSLGIELGLARRTCQWIERDGSRWEPLSGGRPRVPPSSGSAPREQYEKGSSPCPIRAPGQPTAEPIGLAACARTHRPRGGDAPRGVTPVGGESRLDAATAPQPVGAAGRRHRAERRPSLTPSAGARCRRAGGGDARAGGEAAPAPGRVDGPASASSAQAPRPERDPVAGDAAAGRRRPPVRRGIRAGSDAAADPRRDAGERPRRRPGAGGAPVERPRIGDTRPARPRRRVAPGPAGARRRRCPRPSAGTPGRPRPPTGAAAAAAGPGASRRPRSTERRRRPDDGAPRRRAAGRAGAAAGSVGGGRWAAT